MKIFFLYSNNDYFESKKDSVVIRCLKRFNKFNDGNFHSDEIEWLICLLTKNNEINLLEEVLKELFENYRYDKHYKFDKYFEYDKNFVLKLLIYYKNKVSISKNEFNLLIIKEKETKSNSIINFNINNDFFDFKKDDYDEYDYEEFYSEKSDYEISKDIISKETSNEEHYEIIEKLTSPLHIACYYENKEILKLLIR